MVSLALFLGVVAMVWLIVVDKLNAPRPFDYERDA
jgi:hypothetical protein